MSTVQERFETFPFDTEPRVIDRQEDLLLADPVLPPGAVKLCRDHPPIEVVHCDAGFPDRSPPPSSEAPIAVYGSEHLRLEWRTMDGRQSFYHRNCDAAEISFQIAGRRTLMTDLGTVELGPGDFSRIPVGVAHDNYGREDVHLLFYVPAPVDEALPAARTSEVLIPPFEGWEPVITNELITECLAGPDNDVVMAPTDELGLLEHAKDEPERIRVLRPADVPGMTWLYTSSHAHIGRALHASGDGRVYRRIRNADEIQYQVSGHRTLVTQRGTVELGPGDFVQIPVGVAFTSIHREPSEHIAVVTAREVHRVGEVARTGERFAAEAIEALR
jgi:mannose-6-phosphate isomerase-like protein (cupin superfamily)